MTKYFCKCCNYDAKVKSSFDKHLKTKKHIEAINSHPKVTPKSPQSHPKVTIETSKNNDENYICKYCYTSFKYKQGMYRHIKYTCKKNKDEDLKELVKLMNEKIENIKTEMKQKDKEIEKRDKQITKLSKKLQINNIGNNCNNKITNNNVNINLNSYHETDLSLLKNEDYIECIKKCRNCVLKAIEKVHFNPEYPQNMNVCLSNIKENYILLYENGKWLLKDRNDTLLRIYEDKEEILNDYIEENKGHELINFFNKYIDMKDGDEQFMKRVIKDVKIMMYNNRDKIVIKDDEQLETSLNKLSSLDKLQEEFQSNISEEDFDNLDNIE
tara:strand:+ start:32 stop:1012 length:981 start_codon:yes stop_codon:yes gene_type:complete